jgi:hypothetical protein
MGPADTAGLNPVPRSKRRGEEDAMIIRELLVGRIDPYGYNGRENHPSKTDEGTVVKVLRMEIEGLDEVDEVLGDMSYAVWYCRRADGTPVELIEHEVKALLDAVERDPA